MTTYFQYIQVTCRGILRDDNNKTDNNHVTGDAMYKV